MQFETASSPHLGPSNDVGNVMRQVLYALVPGTAASAWYFGWGVLINIVLACLFAIALETLALKLRRRPLKPALTDYSAVVTAWLLALTMPQLSPWWLILVGVFFAIVVAKHLYGGLGYNPFNPAMVGYVVLLISFPTQMTAWLTPISLAENPPGFIDSLIIILSGQPPAGLAMDAFTMATPLDAVKTGLRLSSTLSEINTDPLFGSLGGIGWEWINNWFALGGLWLLLKRIIPWQIPLALILGLGIPAAIFSLSNPDHFATPTFHIFSGGAMLGAFFIATDPVSGATTAKGRFIFGAGVGFLTYVIRTWGGYPDGIAFAVLLMNMAAPMIGYYTQPRVFGK